MFKHAADGRAVIEMRPMKDQMSGTVALLSIDLQKFDMDTKSGLLAEQPASVAALFIKQMSEAVLINVRSLQDAFRQQGLEVLHARIQSMTKDGRDRSFGHRQLGIHVAPGDPAGDFIDGVGPLGDEMVFNKTASGVFPSTNLHYVLSNLGVETLVVCGVFTDECVESAVRAGCDLGYKMVIAADACAAVTQARHKDSLDRLRDRYARILPTQDLLTELTGDGQLD